MICGTPKRPCGQMVGLVTIVRVSIQRVVRVFQSIIGVSSIPHTKEQDLKLGQDLVIHPDQGVTVLLDQLGLIPLETLGVLLLLGLLVLVGVLCGFDCVSPSEVCSDSPVEVAFDSEVEADFDSFDDVA